MHDEIPDETGKVSHEDEKVGNVLYAHISKLKDLDKTIIFLYLEQCSYEEISKITGISIKNVSVRLVRIREKLRSRLSSTFEKQRRMHQDELINIWKKEVI